MYCKCDVFVEKPKIKPFIKGDELRHYLKEDLDIKENDNLVLLTYKYVKDWKNSTIANYNNISPEDIQLFAYANMVEFNHLLGNTNESDYFKMMMTAEIKDYNNGCGEYSITCMLNIIVNIRQFNFEYLTKVFPQKDSEWFNEKVNFESIFIQDKQYTKPYRNRWYMEPVSDACVVISRLNSKYKTEHETYSHPMFDENGCGYPMQPKDFYTYPIWCITNLYNKSRDIQYANEPCWESLSPKIKQHSEIYDNPSYMLKKYDITEMLWDID